jgi:hypothetical protein
MYSINKKNNDINKINPISFKDAGFKERQHLQEWIAKTPNCLGEELLIIQKEFEGFDDTKERLDLLALDKQGNLVIIENKLDDTGKDVVWQALKYVSYCSGLTAQDIEQMFEDYLSKTSISASSKELLTEFFNDEEYADLLNIGYSQRTILVAGKYRKEVTSTVMWLLNNGIDITCFKVTPYTFNSEILLDIRQIIPLEEAEDYMIKIAEKQKEDVTNKRLRGSRFNLRESFWKKFLSASDSNLTQNLSPSTDAWIGVGLGMAGVSLNLVVSKKYVRSEIFINRGNTNKNKETFDTLIKNKDIIESEMGTNLEWERMNNKVTSRIKWENSDLSLYHEDDHESMVEFLIMSMNKMHKVFKKYVDDLER